MTIKYTPTVLKKLEELFEEIGFKIRYEKGNFQSGYCLLQEQKIAVINKFLNLEGRINSLLDILPSIDVNLDELSTEGKEYYQAVMMQ
jgi:hypothetical protein